ncbi:Rne/Rng family ribonuclease [uncultured Psychrobacter sp.]|uniref:Rne/Rng family ribonuclease n=1 Tax=uncultured Psychrobacter sp. TaxID=259303 RepID=UPI00261D3AB8|nr:Rne/Rng family ribonuclease [uncultured Psychrobacter sp.]
MKRILINATQNEEIRVALCKGNHLYDFDLENRTREQKKSNIYKGHVTRVEPSLEAVFVEYGSQRQGFLPIREISTEYLSGNPRDESIKKLIKEGDELIVQVEKEERGNKGAALSTYVSLAGRYLVLMPNNPRGGGISRQISGKLREDMKRMLGNLDLPKGMSVIIRTAGIGKTQEDLQHDLNHLLNIWQAIQEQNKKYPSPRLVHQEAGVVTRAVRDYLRDDIAEIWIDNENAYIEAAGFIDAVMPTQADKLRKYTDYEPMFARFNIEKQIETAYQREVRLPSGGSIVIDQTEALVSIDINSAKSTKGSDVAETAYHTNLEAADEIARQLRLRDMGGLIVIDFIDMNDNKHQKEVEKRLVDATKYDRARVQFGEISKFGLMEMSRQRLRPSLEESTGYICPRCHGNGMIRDLRSLSLSIMRQIEQIALKERQGEVQAEVPTDIAAFILNEKRDSLVYLEQDSGTRITILPHAHLESPNFKLHFNRDGFAPTSYERITDTQQQEHSDLGYDVDWQTSEKERPEQQPTRQPRKSADNQSNTDNRASTQSNGRASSNNEPKNTDHNQNNHRHTDKTSESTQVSSARATTDNIAQSKQQVSTAQPKAVAWLSNLFAQAPQAQTANSVSSRDAAEAIEALVNTGAQSLGSFGQVDHTALDNSQRSSIQHDDQQNARTQDDSNAQGGHQSSKQSSHSDDDDKKGSHSDDRRKRKSRKSKSSKSRQRKDQRDDNGSVNNGTDSTSNNKQSDTQDAGERDNKRANDRNGNRQDSRQDNRQNNQNDKERTEDNTSSEQSRTKRKPHSQRNSRGKLERGETLTADDNTKQHNQQSAASTAKGKSQAHAQRDQDPNEVILQVNEAPSKIKASEVVHLSLDDSKSAQSTSKAKDTQEAGHQTVDDKNTTAKQRHKDKSETTKSKSEDRSSSAASSTKPTESLVESKAPSTESKGNSSDSTSAVENTKKASNAQETSQPSAQKVDLEPKAAKTSSVQSAAVAQPAENDESKNGNKADVSSSTNEDAKGNAALMFTHEALFAARYVTANKFGQASNDPRVVRRQQSMPVAETNAQASPAPATIRGTVGEFIHATLADAQSRLADKGVISCFIQAIEAHTQHTKAADTTGIDASSADDSQDKAFDFSNYGYQPLDADYLTRFDAMTQAVSQFATGQGKTEVAPQAISKRASNDPRGQHPDYRAEEQATLNVPDAQLDEPKQDVQSDQVASSQTTEPDHESSTDDHQVDAHETAATALASEVQADDITVESEQLLKADQALLDDSKATEHTDATKEDSQAAKSKTTIASYKNMIESVAEQLLPQTGMFNLTTPKVPKARSRKPKSEHIKPTQAEKSENDHSNSDS